MMTSIKSPREETIKIKKHGRKGDDWRHFKFMKNAKQATAAKQAQN
jgi:hypothetical protein